MHCYSIVKSVTFWVADCMVSSYKELFQTDLLKIFQFYLFYSAWRTTLLLPRSCSDCWRYQWTRTTTFWPCSSWNTSSMWWSTWTTRAARPSARTSSTTPSITIFPCPAKSRLTRSWHWWRPWWRISPINQKRWVLECAAWSVDECVNPLHQSYTRAWYLIGGATCTSIPNLTQDPKTLKFKHGVHAYIDPWKFNPNPSPSPCL